MSIAVVIPVKNERNGLEGLLDRLLVQVSSDDEIIFVDAGSTDGTQEFLRNYSKKHRNVRFFVSQGATCGGGRNVGIGQTNADIIAHIDGGNFPEVSWLLKLCAPIKEGRADYVTGNITFMRISTRIFGVEIDMGELYGLSLFREFRRDDASGMAGGSSVAYLKWIWKKVGGLPEWCPLGGEDVLFVRKIEKEIPQLRTAFVDDAIVYWQIGPMIQDVWKRKFRFQAHLFLLFETVLELVKGCFIPSILIGTAISALFFPLLRIPALTLFLLEWGRQGIKVSNAFLKRGKHGDTLQKKTLLSLWILVLLEGPNLFARMGGMITGLFAFRKTNAFRKKARKYLSARRALK